jgi:hypothetical protein
MGAKEGLFLSARLRNKDQQIIDDNLYWFPDSTGNYSGLQKMQAAKVQIVAQKAGPDSIRVKISNPANGPVAFFSRVSLVDSKTKKRILPVFYNDNYVSVLPGEEKVVTISGDAIGRSGNAVVTVSGWNVSEQTINIGK